MGKRSYKFRGFKLSKMMPKSWFYLLRDMTSKGRSKVQNSIEKETGNSFEIRKASLEPPQKQDYIKNRPSYYIPSKNRVDKLPFFPTQHHKRTDTNLSFDIPRKNITKPCKKQLSSSVLSSELVSCDYSLPFPLPPIVTKPIKANKPKFSSHGYTRKTCTRQSPRIKMRLNSPKAAKKRSLEKKGLGDSFVVVKLSSDPQSDFKESMLEMIFQNKLWANKDLEELLSCYLYLNTDEYHHLIIKAFKQIWFDLTVMNLNYE